MDNQENVCQVSQQISFADVMVVLFGRIRLFIIITLVTFICACVFILWHNKKMSTYEGMYNYNVACLTEGRYIDGSVFDIRETITLEKLKEYQSEHEELKGLDMKKIYDDGFIDSYKFETIMREVPGIDPKFNDKKEYEVDKRGYRIVFKGQYLTRDQAVILARAIANEPNAKINRIVNQTDYKSYLKLYEKSDIYDDKLEYLIKQLSLVEDNYSNLINNYSDIYLKDGRKLSVVKLAVENHFKNYPLDVLVNKLRCKGYVYDYDEYMEQLEAMKEHYTKEKTLSTNKRDDLVLQRDNLLASAGSLYTLELSKYNEEIIKYTTEIRDFEDELVAIQKKIDNKIKSETDPAYQEEIADFTAEIEKRYNDLVSITDEYVDIAKEVVKDNSIVYYDKTSVLETVSNDSLVKNAVLAFLGSLILAMLVNLILDGNKIFKTRMVETKDDPAGRKTVIDEKEN